MSGSSEVDGTIAAARRATAANIDEVALAVRRAAEGIRAQMDTLSVTRDELLRLQQRVEVEIEVLRERAVTLEEVTLPAVVGGDVPLDDLFAVAAPGETHDVDPEPVGPDEILLEDAPWADPSAFRADRLVALVAFHGTVTHDEAVAGLVEVGDRPDDVVRELRALVDAGRLVVRDDGTFEVA